MASNGGLTGNAWKRARAHVLARDGQCWLCGEDVDKSLDGRHPMGPVVDHVIPKSKGGALFDLCNLKLAHRKCNGSKWDKMPTAIPDAGPSRAWL